MNRKGIENATEKEFDIAIIGGGITGAGIFNEASKQGYACVLIEKNDFASGTSSKSAKMIHGGFRYLKQGKIGIVQESIRERHYLLKQFPHLIKPVPFLFVAYEGMLKYRLGMRFYEYMDKSRSLPGFRKLNKKETVKKYPAINNDGLKGSFIYYDAYTNDARVCNQVIANTTNNFSSIAINYCKFNSFSKKGGIQKLNCIDQINNQEITFKAQAIINASGVWTDEVARNLGNNENQLTAPSKGIHIVLSRDRFPFEEALVFPSDTADKRYMYGLPWENNSYILGTTDTEYSGNIDRVFSEQEEIRYILKATQKFAPALNITAKDVLYTYAGLRPLFKEEKSSTLRSRDYRIWWEGDKILNIYGGKFTSFHAMAVNLVKELREKVAPSGSPKTRTKNKGNSPSDSEFEDKIKSNYGQEAKYIIDIANTDHKTRKPFCEAVETTIAEVIYFIRYQQCHFLDDLLTRRLSLTYVLNSFTKKEEIVERVADLMAIELSWDDETKNLRMEQYFQQFEKSMVGVNSIN